MAGIIRAPRDVAAGVFFIAVGVAALVVGADYRLGTLLSMGPGYFPRIIAGILIALGAGVALTGLRLQGPPLERWPWRALVLVLGSIVWFGWSLERLGLIAAVAVMTFVSAYAEKDRGLVEALLLSAFLAALAWVIFVWALGMPLLLWPEGAVD
jgi:hypothetical protein